MRGEGVYDADGFRQMSLLFGVSMAFSKNISCFTPIVKEEFGLAFTASRSVPVDRASF